MCSLCCPLSNFLKYILQAEGDVIVSQRQVGLGCLTLLPDIQRLRLLHPLPLLVGSPADCTLAWGGLGAGAQTVGVFKVRAKAWG